MTGEPSHHASTAEAQPAGRRLRRLIRFVSVLALVVALAAAGYTAWTFHPLAGRASSASALSPGIGGGSAGAPPAPVRPQPPALPAHAPSPLLPALFDDEASHVRIAGVRAVSGIVVDADSGRVLWERRGHRRMEIASLTKLMTGLLAERGGELSRVVRIRREMIGIGGSSIYLKAGQRITVDMLLHGLLMVSGNDAANALAVYRTGSVPAFVRRMNAEARELGLDDTRFSNPSGLTDRGNHSSAWDVADLGRYVLRRPALARIVRTRTERAPHHVTWVNHDHLLWRFRGANGLKTGYTDRAGPCLAASATRAGRTLIAVVLNARGDEFTQAEAMLAWGFAQR